LLFHLPELLDCDSSCEILAEHGSIDTGFEKRYDWGRKVVEMCEEIVLTSKEKAAIRALDRIAENWPDTLWLFSASGSLKVMRYGPNGEQVIRETGGMDDRYAICTINIPNDGGDW
jgi:hypothetical protein